MCVAEYTYRKHPNSPVKMMESIEESLCGRSAMASLGSQFGIKNVVRWKVRNEEREGVRKGEGAILYFPSNFVFLTLFRWQQCRWTSRLHLWWARSCRRLLVPSFLKR